ncbi:MAG TPA: hypothetical protein VJ461_02660 [Candidatus Nanoarchaeia archaeon]|nr:hypothetical protein [Candidatus Nanoarchaeia archaeon]
MFKIFNKDLTKLETAEIKQLAENSKKIEYLCSELQKVFQVSLELEDNKRKGMAVGNTEEGLRGNTDYAKDLLRQILQMLHNQEEEARKALETELQKQFEAKKKKK